MDGTATTDQIEESPAAALTMVNGLPAYAKLLWAGGDFHWAFGYPAIMHLRDVMTGDMAIVESGYNQFSTWRSEEHTSELQSRQYLVCRLLLEKKNKSKTV